LAQGVQAAGERAADATGRPKHQRHCPRGCAAVGHLAWCFVVA
jgi:hypothetical protein